MGKRKATHKSGKRIIKVFIASPGDLAVERRAFKDTIDELNAGFGRGTSACPSHTHRLHRCLALATAAEAPRRST